MKALEWLSAENRLRREIRRARLRDPARAVAALRRVLDRGMVMSGPTVRLWPELQDALLQRATARALTEDDLRTVQLRGMAWCNRSGNAAHAPRLWQRLAEVRQARGERDQALALLVEAWGHPDADAAARLAVAKDLLAAEASDEPHLRIYRHELPALLASPERAALERLLAARLARTDFGSDRRELQTTVRSARSFEASGLVAGAVQKVLGIGALLLDDDDVQAARHFALALAHDPLDAVAWTGSMLVGVRARDGRRLQDLLAALPAAGGKALADVRMLAETIAWLSLPLPGASPPHAAADLGAIEFCLGVEEDLDLARAHLLLIEGDAASARELLHSATLSARLGQQWSWLSIQAHLLNGSFDAAFRCYAQQPPGAGRWPLAAAILDGSARHGHDPRLFADLLAAPAPFAATATTRIALARRQPAPPPGALAVPLDAAGLEAFRIRLGSVWNEDPQALAACLEEAPFRRLPRAERGFWAGLAQLPSSPDAALALLSAAGGDGHPRAELVVAVTAARTGDPGRAVLALARVPDADNPKAAALRAALALLRGRIEDAEQIAREQAGRGASAACRDMGLLCLHRASRAFGPQRLGIARALRAQAADLFERALAGAGPVPADTEVLARCARFAADPARGLAACAQIWPQVLRLLPEQRSPFVLWNAALARLASGAADVPLEVCRQLADRLADREQSPLPERLAFAGALGAAVRAADADAAAAFAGLAEQLIGGEQDPAAVEVLQRVRLVAARAAAGDSHDAIVARLRGEHATGVGLALLVAVRSLARGQRAEAATVLRQATPMDPLDAKLLPALARLLADQPLAPTALPEAPAGATAATTALCQVLRAACLLQQGQHQAGILALVQVPDLAGRVIELQRFLPWLCTLPARSDTVDVMVRQALADLRTSTRPGALELLALCELAVGETRTAREIWESLLQRDHDHPIRGQYAALLQHLAVRALRENRRQEAVAHLRAAEPWLPGDQVGVRADLLRFAEALEGDDLVARFVRVFFAGQDEPARAPGRLRTLARHLQRHQELRQALAGGAEAQAVAQAWRASEPGRQRDVLHALAVVCRESGLLTPENARAGSWLELGSALWLVLLAGRSLRSAFARSRFTNDDGERVDLTTEQADLLWTRAMKLILDEHLTLGQQALVDGDQERARAHARCLARAASGPDAVTDLLRQHGIDGPLGEEGE